jgi:hypothetical protein
MIGLFLLIHDGTRDMIIKRRLEKLSSIFSTPTAGRAIQFDLIVKDQGPATIVKLERKGLSFFDIVRE